MDRAARIRELNDAFRTTFIGGTVVVTAGIQALPGSLRQQVLDRVRSFADFNGDNDPHHEHDFGAFTVEAVRCNWKIDYYDGRMEYGSEDPGDPAKTTRVLTVMLAEEY